MLFRYEAWGMPVLEAMASGVPVVTTDCLGVRTFCKHGDNCLIAAPDDAAGEHTQTHTQRLWQREWQRERKNDSAVPAV